jgi:phosphoglycerate dehydrogenase-like enzyme
MAEIVAFIPRKDLEPERYRAVLPREFPGRSIAVVESLADCAGEIGDAEALVVHGGIVDDPTIARAKKLRWIHNTITGMDWADRLPSLRPDVMLTRSRIQGPQMSEMVLLHMMALSRGLPGYVRNQAARRWEKWRGGLIGGKTAGILGVGAIAEALAPKLKALGVSVIGISSGARTVPGIERFVDRDRLVEVVPELDYLVVITPLSDATRHIVNAAVFKAMKPTAYLINVARGGVVDEPALIAALEAGEIAGAGLDVYSQEPLPADSPLWGMDKVLMTPHVGGWSLTYADGAIDATVRNMRIFLAGRYDDLIDRVR